MKEQKRNMPIKNIPYKKVYDEKGFHTNPIKQGLINEFPNRKNRRAFLNQERFTGNGKNCHLTVGKNYKFKRVIQPEIDKEGKRKFIQHYIPA